MAHTAGPSARTHRLIGLAATLLLATTTAIAFGRVFLGGSTTLQLLATSIAAGGLAVMFERRSLLLATAGSIAGLALAVGLVVFPGSTWYGLPTDDTLKAALDAAALVGEQARIQIAPAEPIPPLLLAAVVSLWAAVFSAHALAFRAGSPLLGLIPPVALVAFADTVLEEFVKPLYGVAFLAAALLVVFADGLSRVQGWGPIWSSARRGVAATAGRGARRLALTALATAVIAPVIVPGFGSKAVIDFGTAATDRISIDPFVSVKSSLTRRTPVEVLRVTAPRPTYIRLVSLPDFDGATWRPGTDGTGGALAPGQPLPQEGPTGVSDTVVVEVTHDNANPWLPMPYPATSIDVPDASITYEPDTGTAFIDPPLDEGDVYRVQASFLQPDDDDLRAVDFLPVPPDDRYVRLPEMPARVEEIAKEWTEGRTTVFDSAIAIQEHLRDTSVFTYDDEVAPQAGTQTIVDFLEGTRRGFCQQFSASMAVLLRSLGIRARVVVGYTTGAPTNPATDQYSFSTDQAHSWVEVHFPGWGWLPFEPTPGRQNPVVLGYDDPDAQCRGPDCPDGTEPATGGSQTLNERGAAQQGLLDPRPTRLPRGPLRDPGTSSIPTGGSGITARTLLLAGLVLAGAIFLLLPLARVLGRRRRLRRAAAEPRRLILVTLEQFSERLEGLGLGRVPGETLEEHRRRVTATGYLSDGHLDRLTGLATVAAYSSREPDRDQAEDAGTAARTALREIRRAVGPARWLVGLYRR
jgi:transglutaminase-like putative cysteine protease